MPTPASSGALSVAQVNAALQGVETYYTTLPHTNLQQDLSSLAAHMTASGAFTAAAVSPGGITAALPDGTTALVFADRDEELGGFSADARLRSVRSARGSAARAAAAAAPMATASPSLSPATAHEVAFFVNEADTNAFTPQVQDDFGAAFRNLSFPQAGYGVDVLDISLDNIVALGTSAHPRRDRCPRARGRSAARKTRAPARFPRHRNARHGRRVLAELLLCESVHDTAHRRKPRNVRSRFPSRPYHVRDLHLDNGHRGPPSDLGVHAGVLNGASHVQPGRGRGQPVLLGPKPADRDGAQHDLAGCRCRTVPGLDEEGRRRGRGPVGRLHARPNARRTISERYRPRPIC